MIVLGRIVAPYGVQGWVRIHPFGDDPLSWKTMGQWWVSPDDTETADAWRPIALRQCRMHGQTLLAAFADVVDRNGAEALQGLYVGAPREALPATAPDEFYWADLIGLAVVNRAGEALGEVKSLLSTGAHDVLEVRDGEQEHLIPFVAAYVDTVDQEAKLIRVDWQKDW